MHPPQTDVFWSQFHWWTRFRVSRCGFLLRVVETREVVSFSIPQSDISYSKRHLARSLFTHLLELFRLFFNKKNRINTAAGQSLVVQPRACTSYLITESDITAFVQTMLETYFWLRCYVCVTDHIFVSSLLVLKYSYCKIKVHPDTKTKTTKLV